ncbi:FadR/GntR family transcriptional regulator [Streptomyces sp. NPDC047070]|uniref:FadR/GntR family transcriptional regulator n=1 Tax=Streptomyces sp. NPDC047070 TaxID=3154923 RepID=UPI0034573A12
MAESSTGGEARRSDEVITEILRRILNGRLRPGDRLPAERDLAVEFGVSRTALREAISNLTGRGLIASRGGSGLRVTAVAPERAHEALFLYLRDNDLDYAAIHEVREVIEVHTAGVAATRADETTIRALRAANEELNNSRGDVTRAIAADFEFHRLVSAIAGNEIFSLILSSLRGGLIAVREHNLALLPAHEEACKSHEAIAEAIAAGNADNARRHMEHHLRAVFTYWQKRSAESLDDIAATYASPLT